MPSARFSAIPEQGAEFLVSVQGKQKALHRQMRQAFSRRGMAVPSPSAPEALLWLKICRPIWGEIQSVAHDIGQLQSLAPPQWELGMAVEENQI